MAEGINVSTVRQILRSSGLNSSNSGIKALKEAIDNYAKLVVDKAKAVAESKKKKTIQTEEIAEALKQLTNQVTQ